jgi:hypothetical protein
MAGLPFERETYAGYGRFGHSSCRNMHVSERKNWQFSARQHSFVRCAASSSGRMMKLFIFYIYQRRGKGGTLLSSVSASLFLSNSRTLLFFSSLLFSFPFPFNTATRAPSKRAFLSREEKRVLRSFSEREKREQEATWLP